MSMIDLIKEIEKLKCHTWNYNEAIIDVIDLLNKHNIIHKLEKLTQVVDILKIKKVRLIVLAKANVLEDYNKYCVDHNKLTQEEFNLLKEVF